MVGPAAVTLLATQVHPAAGVTAAAVRCLAGTLWFASQRATEPPVAVRPVVLSRILAERRPAYSGEPRRFSLAAPGLIVLVPVYLFLGAMFVSVDLCTVAFATQLRAQAAGRRASSAATRSAAATGGLWYGHRNWRSPAWRRSRDHAGAHRGRRVHVLARCRT